MILWRISEFATLDGAGGLITAGRWHERGRPIVYLADSSALAMLEVYVHLERRLIPPPFQLLRVETPDGLARSTWDKAASPPDLASSRAWGSAWLSDGEAVARVPSAIAPHAFNWLLNPLHADAAEARLTAASRWPWDERLFAA